MSVSYKEIDCGVMTACDSMENVESVSLNIMAKVGGRHEVPEEYGISHFVEHMAFKGTYNAQTGIARDKKQLATALDELGGHFNAYTSKEVTNYVCRIPKAHFEEGFSIIADIIANPVYDLEEIELERGVIIQEIGMCEDDPEDKVVDGFYETCFKDQSFGATILGPIENIKKFQRADFLSYIDRFYHNKNIIVAAAGNIAFEDLEVLTKEYFGHRKSLENISVKAPIFIGGDHREEKDLEQVHVLMGFPGFHKSHDDYIKMKITSAILGSGMSSRLFQEIRENLGLAYHVSSSNTGYRDCGLFSIYGAVDPSNANLFIEKSLEETKKMIDYVTIEELEKVKKQMRCAILMSTDGTSSRLSHLINSLADYGRYVTNEELLDKINKVDLHSIKQCISDLLNNGKSTLASIGKISGLMPYEEFLTKLNKGI